MKIISVINYKGGVGKTTMTANLAAELAFRGYRILMIDLDPQASLTFSFVKPDVWERDLAANKTIKSWFDSFIKDKPFDLNTLITSLPEVKSRLGSRGGALDLIASHLGLINVDLELATKLSGASLSQAKENFLRVHRRLAEGLGELDEEYDLVLIDCPPNFNIVTKNAIVACQQVVIPAKPDYLSTLGIDYLIRSLKMLVKDYNDYASHGDDSDDERIDPKILGVVFTMVQEYGNQPISAIRPFMKNTERLGIPVFEKYVKENKTIFADAPLYGVPVVLTAPSAQSHKDVVGGIEEVVTEFETRAAIKKGGA